jgi:hypothetical protein
VSIIVILLIALAVAALIVAWMYWPEGWLRKRAIRRAIRQSRQRKAIHDAHPELRALAGLADTENALKVQAYLKAEGQQEEQPPE